MSHDSFNLILQIYNKNAIKVKLHRFFLTFFSNSSDRKVKKRAGKTPRNSPTIILTTYHRPPYTVKPTAEPESPLPARLRTCNLHFPPCNPPPFRPKPHSPSTETPLPLDQNLTPLQPKPYSPSTETLLPLHRNPTSSPPKPRSLSTASLLPSGRTHSPPPPQPRSPADNFILPFPWRQFEKCLPWSPKLTCSTSTPDVI